MTTLKGLINLSHLYRIQNSFINMAKHEDAQGHVLMFHHITDKHIDVIPECVCNVSEFKNILDAYKEEGYEFVDIDTGLYYLNYNKPCKFVVISFDDIPDDVYINAYPILKEYNAKFTIFVASGLIGKEDYITLEHLTTMANNPLCTVGAHTVNHPHLGKMDNCHYEIFQSKIDLEKLLHCQIKHFAYPYGSVSAVPNRAINEVRNACFSTAFCTVQGPLSKGALLNPFFLPRNVAMSNKVVEFKKNSLLKTIIYKLLKK